nr:exostosin-like 2 [Nerophis lumbriciformis]
MHVSEEQKAENQLANFRVGCTPGWLCLWSFLLLLLVGIALTVLHRPHNDSTEKPGDLTVVKQDGFTLIIQTFKRDDILVKVLKRCLAVPHLQKILIVWNNINKPPSQKLRDSLGPHRTPIIFLEQKVNSMQNRLQPFSEIQTDAVLMLDDDILLSVSDISFAFRIWKQSPDQIVGFVPRRHAETAPGVYTYGGSELSDPQNGGEKYSMVLISAVFFHRRYLQLYQEQPKEVHNLVDDTHNCDDIAMNFVVAMHLRKLWGSGKPAGIYIKPKNMVNLELQANSGFKGLWHRPDHFKQRSYCLTRLAQIYGVMPLQFSNIMMTQLT